MSDRASSAPRNSSRIRQLNDELRTTLSGGTVVVTVGVRALSPDAVTEALKIIVAFNEFPTDSDPFGERDFGVFTLAGVKCFWKIDYYDLEKKFGSPDPTNPEVTCRVLTIMLASEY